MTENKKLNDEMMENVAGGTGVGMDIRIIAGVVLVDPYPDDSLNDSVWDDCQANGYSVYELTDGAIAVASPELPPLSTGDKVCVNAIRGCYGWEIEGVIDGQL